MASPNTLDSLPIRYSVEEYGRGVAGGLLFSLPMLYTMEIWQFGSTLPPLKLAIYVLATFCLLLGYNRFVGLHDETSWLETVIDAIEELGIGLLLTILILFLMARIQTTMTLAENTGRVIVAGMTVAIGVSVGTSQLGGDAHQKHQQAQASGTLEQANQDSESLSASVLQQAAVGFFAAVLVASNIAPTQEVLVLGAEISTLRLVGLVAMSLIVSSVVLFYSDFPGAQALPGESRLRTMFERLMLSYAVALLTSGFMLWFFGRFDGASLDAAVSELIAFGFVTTLGASAGRLLLR